ncbi:MAG: T9SS type A sorting domain-containing protein [Bacteroidetes bacterium]|nr:T9SS type A sorting domain-containing protein [Bacteroidota bacterium]
MRTKHTIDEALRAVRDDERPPLLRTEDIEELVRTNPTPATSTPPPSHLLPWTIGGLALAATTVGIVWWNSSDHTEQMIDASDVNVVASTADHTTVNPAAPPPSQHRDAPAAEPVRISTLAPTENDLTTLGLVVSGSQLQYRDGRSLVTVTTTGISVVDDGGDADSLHIVPRMVTLFRQGTHFAAWWDRTDDDAASNLRTKAVMPNDLVPVKVTLKDPSSPMFREADVILWYPAFRRGLDPFKQRNDVRGAIVESNIYPNPLQQGEATLHVTLDQQRTASIDVFDLQGATILHIDEAISNAQGEHRIRLPFDASVPTGMYIIVLTTTAGERSIQRLMIER